MASYISSNANRFYAALEGSYGVAASIMAANRFPAVQLRAHQSLAPAKRLDKTGTRTFFGQSKDARRYTAFELKTYLTSWSGSQQPGYGPLIQAALGAAPQLAQGLTIASMQETLIQTMAAHNLTVGSAISRGNEIRFVTAINDANSFTVNAPFTSTAEPGTNLAPAITYKAATALPSVTLYDFWDPAGTISRVLTGAAVNTLEAVINGDFHELGFGGIAADLLDSTSFTSGEGGLASFPQEPTVAGFDYSIVPGHLGQVWLGPNASQFFTLIEAHVQVKNNLATRNQEFGSSYPRAIAPGPREVVSNLKLFAQDDTQTTALYAMAKERSPIAAMLQMGQQQGQIMGIFLPNMVPEIPNYNDSETRLLWEFTNNLAQGVGDDEIYIAFA